MSSLLKQGLVILVLVLIIGMLIYNSVDVNVAFHSAITWLKDKWAKDELNQIEPIFEKALKSLEEESARKEQAVQEEQLALMQAQQTLYNLRALDVSRDQIIEDFSKLLRDAQGGSISYLGRTLSPEVAQQQLLYYARISEDVKQRISNLEQEIQVKEELMVQLKASLAMHKQSIREKREEGSQLIAERDLAQMKAFITNLSGSGSDQMSKPMQEVNRILTLLQNQIHQLSLDGSSTSDAQVSKEILSFEETERLQNDYRKQTALDERIALLLASDSDDR